MTYALACEWGFKFIDKKNIVFNLKDCFYKNEPMEEFSNIYNPDDCVLKG